MPLLKYQPASNSLGIHTPILVLLPQKGHVKIHILKFIICDTPIMPVHTQINGKNAWYIRHTYIHTYIFFASVFPCNNSGPNLARPDPSSLLHFKKCCCLVQHCLFGECFFVHSGSLSSKGKEYSKSILFWAKES